MKNNFNSGLVISLDLEFFWGVSDSKSFQKYRTNVSQVNKIFPRLIKLFDDYNIKATFATVGLVFLEDVKVLDKLFKEIDYSDKFHNLNFLKENYHFIKNNKDSFFLNKKNKKLLLDSKHEIASHTFSHFYNLDHNIEINDIENDLKLFRNKLPQISKKIKSIIFPRNQYNY